MYCGSFFKGMGGGVIVKVLVMKFLNEKTCLFLFHTTNFSLFQIESRFADDRLNIGKMMISLFDGVENTVGKGENAGNQHFLLFPQCFAKPSSLVLLRVGIVW